MKKTVLCHFYNEEYLLPWWLNHHKNYFDHGIMINYASTDKSVEIIKNICPTWEIIDSENSTFQAAAVDAEVQKIEKNITGWKICLTITEYLIGNYDLLDSITENKQFIAYCYHMVDTEMRRKDVDPQVPFFLQNMTFGLPVNNNLHGQPSGRSLHNFNIDYPSSSLTGRHVLITPLNIQKDFIILKYYLCPMTPEFVARKLQIQHRIPDSDKARGLGFQHYNLTQTKLEETLYKKDRRYAVNLMNEIEPYLKLNKLI